jgi:NAD(P)-dependent dehydrogenase (short-subunit alcohol dehydrogenase family)
MTRRGFAGKTVVVTGAAGGLGRSLCLRFGAAGARVGALDRDPDGLQALARDMRAQGLGVFTQVCDVTDAAGCEDAMRAIHNACGPVDILVNNAGISHRSAFAQTHIEVIRRVMDVNFFGAVNCTHAALADLRAARGVVIAISSVAGFSPLIGRTGYAASKHALHGFFDSLRTELADDGVDVMLVCPSFIATGIDGAALGGDGQLATRPRQTAGAQMTPDAAARAIFDAASRGRKLLLLSATARIAWLITRCWPGLYAALMTRRLRSEISPNTPPQGP